MKAVILSALVLVIATCAYAATPSAPQWPSAFSASVLAQRADWRGPRTDFFRWFYDYTQKMERFDGMVMWHEEPYFAEIITDYNKDIEYSVFYQDESASCFTRAVNWTMMNPTFSSFDFAGTSVVGYDVAYHWMYQDQRGDYFQLWDRQSDREIIRIDFAGREGFRETWTFMEMDEGSQDANIFTLPDLIANTCNSM